MLQLRKSINNSKKIALLLPSFAEHDAMGNYVEIYADIFRRAGYEIQIFARFFDSKFKGKVKSYEDFKSKDFDLLNYHHGIGDPVAEIAIDTDIPILLYYHNITPAEYYLEYNWEIYQLLVQGRDQLKQMAKNVDFALSASRYSDRELEQVGYINRDIIPVFFNPGKLMNIKPDQKTINYLNKHKFTNITFVGRFSAHKDQESLVKAFYLYKNHYNRESRLNLVGSCFEKRYLERIKEIIKKLGLEDSVNIPGMVSDEQLRAYFEQSAVMLSMSEHEGFFVPVLEANFYETPIIAYNGGAVSDTMGDAGILLKTKKPDIVAGIINKVVSDTDLRAALIENGKENYKKYAQELYEQKLLNLVESMIGE